MAAEWASTDETVAPTQRCVCFTETPLEHTWMMTSPMAGRQTNLSKYGLAITKAFARRMAVNPVWYLDMTMGHDWLTVPINHLVKIAQEGKSTFVDEEGKIVGSPPPARDPILALTPFLEQMFSHATSRKEFWWEREWRKVGHFPFPWSKVVAVFAPESDHDDFVSDLAKLQNLDEDYVERRLKVLDPDWGLERMVAKLAGVSDEDAGPFPPAS